MSCSVTIAYYIVHFITCDAFDSANPINLQCLSYLIWTPTIDYIIHNIISNSAFAFRVLTREVKYLSEEFSFRNLFNVLQSLCYVSFNSSYLLSVFFQSIPDLVEQLDQDTLTRDLICDNHLHVRVQLAYIIVMSAFCLIQSFRARNLPRNFKETKRVLYSMFLTIVILLVSFPIDLSMKENDSRVALTFFFADIDKLYPSFSYVHI